MNLICSLSSLSIREERAKAQQAVLGPTNCSWQKAVIMPAACASAQRPGMKPAANRHTQY